MGLEDNNFKLLVDRKPISFKPQDWKDPKATNPPPVWIIVLLDFSGSMNEKDRSGVRKISGAIAAVRELIKNASARGGDTRISVVPFGLSGPGCKQGYNVDQTTLDNFLPIEDAKLQNHLDYLNGLTPCASTNLYDSLAKAVKFFDNSEDKRFYPPTDSDELLQPRLSVILLSDGYDDASPDDDQSFHELSELLKRSSNVTVHTLGYGLTAKELGEKYHLGRPATRTDVGKGKAVPEEEFVDEGRLREIAKLTGGISEFSANAKVVADKFRSFMDELLGEYEISYTEPNADRGSQHDVQVDVTSSEGTSTISEVKKYTIRVFGRPLPLKIRLIMLGILGILAIGGIVPFYFWGKSLKEEALRD